jgi:hypothetical protein
MIVTEAWFGKQVDQHLLGAVQVLKFVNDHVVEHRHRFPAPESDA